MNNRKKSPPALISAFLLTLAAACGPSRPAVDTSTPDDWKANCAQYHRYGNELIFSAVETTTADGRRVRSLAARDREAYLDVFRQLSLDGVPDLKARRDRILEAAGRAPGGGDCIAFDPEKATVEKAGGRWKIVAGGHWLFDFGGKRAEALASLFLIKVYGFNHLCTIVRGKDRHFSYLRR